MGVTATDDIAIELCRIANRIVFNLLCGAEEEFAVAFRQFSKVVGLINPLEEVVDTIGDPGQDRIAGNELVEAMAVQKENPGLATANHDFIRTGHPE
jgi:hypothetical protein